MREHTDAIRLAVVSDLYHEDRSFSPLDTDELKGRADMLVVAGNIGSSVLGLAWCTRASVPCVYVLGNREFHGNSYVGTRGRIANTARYYPSLHYLDDTAVEREIRGHKVRFLGGTLWTDYCLYGKRRCRASMLWAVGSLSDHDRIRHGNRLWMPQDAAAAFDKTRTFIATELAKPFEGLTVVVTHHAPTRRAIPKALRGDELNPARASNLEDLVVQADAWIFGHLDHAVDITIGRCRVISNPHGSDGRDFKLRIFEIPTARS